MDKNICKHTNKVKIGKKIYSNGVVQMYRCKDCYAFVKGEKTGSIPKVENLDKNAIQQIVETLNV